MLKVVICGNCGVGKTKTAKCLRGEPFVDHYETTCGADVMGAGDMLMNDSRVVQLIIWDITGKSEYSALTSAFYQGANAIILMFDITDQQSFSDLKSVWLEQIQSSIYPCVIPSDVHLVVVGNKADLEAQRAVRNEEAGKFAEEIGALGFIEISARSELNMKELLEHLSIIERNSN